MYIDVYLLGSVSQVLRVYYPVGIFCYVLPVHTCRFLNSVHNIADQILIIHHRLPRSYHL